MYTYSIISISIISSIYTIR